MPIYEYTCSECGKEFEKLVRAGFKGTVDCPKCGKQSKRNKVMLFGLTASNTGLGSSAANCAPSG